MKKLISLFLCLLLVTSLTSSCAKNNLSSPSKVKTIKIGVALYKFNDTFISTILSHFEAAAKEKEKNLGIKIDINAVDGKGNQMVQNEQVDQFLKQNYDVICINMVDRTAAAVIIDKAKRAKIPLIFLNREPVEEDLERWDQLYYVGAIAVLSGSMQGKIAVDAFNRNSKSVDKNKDNILQYVMLEGEPGHQDALLRTEYSVKAVTQAGIEVQKLANDTANWQRGQACTKMTQWITKFGDKIEVIFSNNDDMALGAIDAYNILNIEKEKMPLIIGVDATPPALNAIHTGTLTGTVLSDAKGQAQAMLELSYCLAFDKNPKDSIPYLDGKYIRLPHKIITLDNIKQFEKENQ
ncbi:galactose ABC transporter substrate-binding protein [Paludicola sp. MB14-C6]|uniref:galactose ABC transporter substrate-binding protein n=1 Tax=Paludihabitans sp. MB14-C6 TaxID=3070656 RepID=UPI0027DB324F|nr:galactose ABC transporter substrate-binding protein [Paludicola sp. MB14-C6]WMJ21843.1 galactose ABC transporter substrate-binding protein [Paludicola sp. MB14-C6]